MRQVTNIWCARGSASLRECSRLRHPHPPPPNPHPAPHLVQEPHLPLGGVHVDIDVVPRQAQLLRCGEGGGGQRRAEWRAAAAAAAAGTSGPLSPAKSVRHVFKLSRVACRPAHTPTHPSTTTPTHQEGPGLRCLRQHRGVGRLQGALQGRALHCKQAASSSRRPGQARPGRRAGRVASQPARLVGRAALGKQDAQLSSASSLDPAPTPPPHPPPPPPQPHLPAR